MDFVKVYFTIHRFLHKQACPIFHVEAEFWQPQSREKSGRRSDTQSDTWAAIKNAQSNLSMGALKSIRAEGFPQAAEACGRAGGSWLRNLHSGRARKGNIFGASKGVEIKSLAPQPLLGPTIVFLRANKIVSASRSQNKTIFTGLFWPSPRKKRRRGIEPLPWFSLREKSKCYTKSPRGLLLKWPVGPRFTCQLKRNGFCSRA